MGDISEMRGLLVIISTIFILVAMVIIIPVSIIESNVTNSQTAGVVNPAVAVAWNTTYVANLTWSSTIDVSQNFQLNGFNYAISVYPAGVIRVNTYASWWIFEWESEDFHWWDNNGVQVSEDFTFIYTNHGIRAMTVNDYETPASFRLVNSKTSATVTTAYNTTAYSTFSSALVGGGAQLIFNVDWNERDTSLNAFQLLGMLYTASLPGLDPLVNYLITIPLWIGTVYLAFIFTLRLVGALFGGGA